MVVRWCGWWQLAARTGDVRGHTDRVGGCHSSLNHTHTLTEREEGVDRERGKKGGAVVVNDLASGKC